MNIKKLIGRSLIATNLLFGSLYASDYSIEVDPGTYAFGGYSLHLKKNIEHFQVGVGLYAMDFPDIFVDMHENNRDKNWDVRLNSGVGFFTDYYFQNAGEGFFLGGQLAYQQYKIKNGADTSEYETLLAMASFGYSYHITEAFYLKPWAGVGYSSKISGSNEANGLSYEIPEIVPFATLHIGYNF